MPLSADHWPLLDLLFLAWSTILPLFLLQVNKINSLCKIAKNPFSHQSVSLISQSASIYFFMCLFFLFSVRGPKPCFSNWLEQNIDAHNSTYSLLGKSLQSISHSSSNSFLSSLKLSLGPIGEFMTLPESLQTGQPPSLELITSKSIPLQSFVCVTATPLTCWFLQSSFEDFLITYKKLVYNLWEIMQ